MSRAPAQADKDPELEADAFEGIDKMKAQVEAAKQAAADKPGTSLKAQELEALVLENTCHCSHTCISICIFWTCFLFPRCLICLGQTRDKLKRFLDSILQKGGKIRSLVRELRETFVPSETINECLDVVQSGHVYYI